MSHRLFIFFFLPFVLLAAACNNSHTNTATVAASRPSVKHSYRFSIAVDSAMQAYYRLTESFVNWDSVSVQTAAGALQNNVGRLSTELVPQEKNVPQANALSLLRKVDGALEQIRNVTDIASQRRSYNDATKSIYAFLEAIQWGGSPIYLQECPMAFGDEVKDSGYWLSPVNNVRNPYLGLHHPTYGRSMIGCGDTQDSLSQIVTK